MQGIQNLILDSEILCDPSVISLHAAGIGSSEPQHREVICPIK